MFLDYLLQKDTAPCSYFYFSVIISIMFIRVNIILAKKPEIYVWPQLPYKKHRNATPTPMTATKIKSYNRKAVEIIV